MAKSPPYRAGDLFSVPLPDGTSASARILLDVTAQCMLPKRVPRTSPLKPFEGTLLVEVYREPVTAAGATPAIAIPGVFIDPEPLTARGKDRWSIAGHAAVDPARVAFPEALTYGDHRVRFVAGEIERTIQIDQQHLERFTTRPSFMNPARFVAVCCYYLGRKHLLGEAAEQMTLRKSDLRFNDDRDEIYRYMGEDPAQSYYEAAKAMGFDLARFYE